MGKPARSAYGTAVAGGSASIHHGGTEKTRSDASE